MPTIGDAINALEAAVFTGRERELDSFESWLADDDPIPQILNVSGRGGVGKTCLALRSRALHHYRERMQKASQQERQRLLKDRLFLLENAVLQDMLYSEDEPEQVWVETGRPSDHDDIRRIWIYTREHSFCRELGFDAQPEGDLEFLEIIIKHSANRLRVARNQEGRAIWASSMCCQRQPRNR